MKKTLSVLIAVLVLSSLLLAACGGAAQPAAAEKPAVPAEYAGKTNPFEGNADAAAAGKTIYETNCASCHGNTGMGDGPAGASLKPPAAKLSELVATEKPDMVFWRVAEGGMMAPFNSSMPAWKDILSQDEMWQVVTYVYTFKK